MPLNIIHSNHLVLLKNKRLQAFIQFAMTEGWWVRITTEGNIQLKRKGYASIYNGSYLLEKAQYTTKQQIKYPLSIQQVTGRNYE